MRGKSIIWQIIKTYSHHGINDFVIRCVKLAITKFEDKKSLLWGGLKMLATPLAVISMDDKTVMNEENPMKKQELSLSGTHIQYQALVGMISC